MRSPSARPAPSSSRSSMPAPSTPRLRAPNSTTDGTDALFTPVTMLNDEQTTFTFGNDQEYNPHNYKDEYHGEVTATYALAHSLNNATISLGQMVGFSNVAVAGALGRHSLRTRAPLRSRLEPTPPHLSIWPAHIRCSPTAASRSIPGCWPRCTIAQRRCAERLHSRPRGRSLDPRVAYLTTSMMEVVHELRLRLRGAAAWVSRPRRRARPGTPNDAWFAGYTSNLLCIVWVGNDDYTDIVSSPERSAAAPIWAEFMKAAI